MGLFSPKGEDEFPVELNQGKWDIDHIPEGLDGEEGEAQAIVSHAGVFFFPVYGRVSSYSEAIQHMPVPYYYSTITGIVLRMEHTEPLFPGSILPPFDPTALNPKALRRSVHDTFRCPYDSTPMAYRYIPASKHLHSIGYGKEVGLPDGVQELHIIHALILTSSLITISKICFLRTHDPDLSLVQWLYL